MFNVSADKPFMSAGTLQCQNCLRGCAVAGGTGSTISKCQVQLNFKVTGKSSYSDPEGKERGSFVYDPLSGAIAFKLETAVDRCPPLHKPHACWLLHVRLAAPVG